MIHLTIKSSENGILPPLMFATLVLIILSPFLVLSDVSAQQSPLGDQLLEETQTMPYLRWKWFYDQRAYPYGEIPPGAMKRARQYLKDALATEKLMAAPPVGGNIWTQIGPAPAVSRDPRYLPSSGRIRSIAIQSSSVIYIGAATGGVWKTTNAGPNAIWTPLTDDQPSLNMGSVAIEPSNSAVIYAGTGEYSGKQPANSLYGAGLLKSTNSGNSWTHIPGPWDTNEGGAEIQKVVVIAGPKPSEANDDIVLVAGNNGLFRSEHGGEDFTDISTPVLGGNVSDVIVDPTNTSILYAAENGVGIYRSIDGGQTWDADPSDPYVVDPIWTPTVPCSIARGTLALAPTDTNILYAAFHTPPDACGASTGSGAIFRSPNAQAASPAFFQRTSPTPWCGSCGYHLSLIVQDRDPDGPGPLKAEDIVYTGGVGFHRSTNGGSTWLPILGLMHVDVHTLAFDRASGTLYAGNDGGIDMLANPATAPSPNPGWVSLNTNLAITQFYPGVSLNQNSVQSGWPLALGGTQDNATGLYTGNMQWERIGGGDGGYTAFDFTDPDKIFYISTTGYSLWIDKTINGGDSFISNIGPTPSNGWTIAAPFVMCPDNADVLIANNDFGVWRTNDGAMFGASSWFDNSPDFGTFWHHSPSALAFAPGSNCNTYFAGGSNPNGYLYRTTTGGGTTCCNLGDDWNDITGNLPNRELTDIAVNPTNTEIVYVTVSGFCGNTASCPANQGHVWKTDDVLAPVVAWTDLTGGKGLPNVPVNAIVLDPADPPRLYIGTDLGVYRSMNGGTTWELFQNGLPNVIVTDLVLNNNTGVLVAATYGRSMYRLSGAVYVDAGWTGYENGTINYPFNTLSEGVSAVPSWGEVLMKGGSYTGAGNAPITIDKPMTISNYDGLAVIGSP